MKSIEIENIRNRMYENVRELIKTGKLEEKKLIIFGANNPSEYAAEYLENNGYKIYAVVDNNEKKREMLKKGLFKPFIKKYMIESPKEVLERTDKEKFFIIIASKAYHSMCMELEKMGYDIQKQTVQLLQFREKTNENFQKGKEIDLEEMKKIELELLDYFDRYCSEKKLRHYICGGTLLGAVRHKGFIPWDDDIDVLMPVPDYLKFISEFEESDRYALQNCDTCISPYMFTRLVRKDTILMEENYPFVSRTAINIDIFPVSGFPKEKMEIETFSKELFKHRKDWDEFWYAYDNNALIENKYQEMVDRTYDLMTRYDFETSETVGYIVTAKLDRELLPRECFTHTLELPFEGRMYPVFNGYKIYLENLYGDYMVLPPVGQRISKHEFKAWYEEDTNYREL